MKLSRILLITLLLVCGFWFVTTHFSPSASAGRHSLFPVGRSLFGAVDHRIGSLDLKEALAAPAYDAEEQNNISVYKRVSPSVVNITSTSLVFDFFTERCRSRARDRVSSSTRPDTS